MWLQNLSASGSRSCLRGMRHERVTAGGRNPVVLVMALLAPRPASADADKEHQLLMAEIRMLQEEQQQLRAVLLGLGDTLKALNGRLDTDAGQSAEVLRGSEARRRRRRRDDADSAREGRRHERAPVVDDAGAAGAPADRRIHAAAGASSADAADRRAGRRRSRARAPAAGTPPAGGDRIRRRTFRRRRCGIACTRSTPPASSIWRSKASSRSSGRSRRRHRPTMRSCTSGIRSTTPASIPRR